jgi:hypothetical protein
MKEIRNTSYNIKLEIYPLYSGYVLLATSLKNYSANDITNLKNDYKKTK